MFDQYFLSSNAMDGLLSEIDTCLTKVEKGESSVGTIRGVMSKREAVVKMKLNYELPYNEWLYELLVEKLTPLQFAVFHKDKNCIKPVAPISEYIYCKSDILLYHESDVEMGSIKAVQVAMSQLSINEEDEITYRLQGCISELKVCSCDTAAENECYMNMFGEEVKLTANALCKGKIVTTVCMFGILVAAHKHQRALLLKLNIDYTLDQCTFMKSRICSPFVGLLNDVLSILVNEDNEEDGQ